MTDVSGRAARSFVATDRPAADTREPASPTPAATGQRAKGVVAMLTGAASAQTGAAIGAHAFPVLGPVGVAAIRQIVAAVVLIAVARPRLHRMTWAQWWPALVLGGIFAVMNTAVYTAVDRIGLGLTVTLEFLGPLAVALIASRGPREIGLAVLAAVGVYVLVLPGPSSDLVGIGIALLAAALWALYIVLNRVAGRRLPGLQAPAVASVFSATLLAPVVVWLAVTGRLFGLPLLLAVAAGVLSSAVVYAADVTALRFVPAASFGVFMSVHPVFAAVAGLLILGQQLAVNEWLGILVIVAVNAVATLRRR